MRTRWIAAALGAGLLGTFGLGALDGASAQPYGGGGYGGGYGGSRGYGDPRGGYDEPEGYERRPRSRGYDEDDGYRGGRVGFNANEYMRCNPDVRRALQTGNITSAADHWRIYGQREGRRLTC